MPPTDGQRYKDRKVFRSFGVLPYKFYRISRIRNIRTFPFFDLLIALSRKGKPAKWELIEYKNRCRRWREDWNWPNQAGRQGRIQGSPAASFETDDARTYFIVTFPIHPAFIQNEPQNEPQNSVAVTSKREIKYLRERGILSYNGPAKSGRWIINPDA